MPQARSTWRDSTTILLPGCSAVAPSPQNRPKSITPSRLPRAFTSPVYQDCVSGTRLGWRISSTSPVSGNGSSQCRCPTCRPRKLSTAGRLRASRSRRASMAW